LTEELRNSRWLRRLVEDQSKGEELLSMIPQGSGSGLDADMVDSHHYSDFVDLLLRIEKTSGPGSPVTISGGSAGPHKDNHIVGGSDAFNGATDQLSIQAEHVATLPTAVEARIVYLTSDGHIYVGIA